MLTRRVQDEQGSWTDVTGRVMVSLSEDAFLSSAPPSSTFLESRDPSPADCRGEDAESKVLKAPA